MEIGAVKQVLFIPLGMNHLKFGWIEKPACIQAAGGDEVTRFLISKSKVETAGGRAKRTIGSCHAASGLRLSQARAGGDLDDQAGFVSILGRWRARDHFQGLNGIHRNLVGKNFACLIGHRLAVDGKRILRVIADPMDQAIRICHRIG